MPKGPVDHCNPPDDIIAWIPAEGALRRSFQSNHIVGGRSATPAHGYLAVVDVLGVHLVSLTLSIQLMNLFQLCPQTSLCGLLLVMSNLDIGLRDISLVKRLNSRPGQCE